MAPRGMSGMRWTEHSALSSRARAARGDALGARGTLTKFATLYVLLAAGAGACAPQRPGDEVFLDQPVPECDAPTAAAPQPMPAGTVGPEAPPPLSQAALTAAHTTGRAIGHAGGMARALRYVDRLTGDGFWVRGTFARVIAGLAAAALGALAAVFLLTLRVKRPVARWGDSLVHQLRRETREVRGLGAAGDGGQRGLVAQFEEALQAAETKADKLAERCRPLEDRAESATSQAHLESLYAQMEAVLGQVEHIHFQIIAWSERAAQSDEAGLQTQVAAAVEGLLRAMKEAV